MLLKPCFLPMDSVFSLSDYCFKLLDSVLPVQNFRMLRFKEIPSSTSFIALGSTYLLPLLDLAVSRFEFASLRAELFLFSFKVILNRFEFRYFFIVIALYLSSGIEDLVPSSRDLSHLAADRCGIGGYIVDRRMDGLSLRERMTSGLS